MTHNLWLVAAESGVDLFDFKRVHQGRNGAMVVEEATLEPRKSSEGPQKTSELTSAKRDAILLEGLGTPDAEDVKVLVSDESTATKLDAHTGKKEELAVPGKPAQHEGEGLFKGLSGLQGSFMVSAIACSEGDPREGAFVSAS
eukprot:scaffold5014_cov387-Prasinococcus_capsulatus_cf.AAC.7